VRERVVEERGRKKRGGGRRLFCGHSVGNADWEQLRQRLKSARKVKRASVKKRKSTIKKSEKFCGKVVNMGEEGMTWAIVENIVEVRFRIRVARQPKIIVRKKRHWVIR
jgi:hypothetical protein